MKPERKTKRAFVSPKQQRDIKGKLKPIVHTDLGFNLETVFKETDRKRKNDSEEDENEFERDYNLPGSYKSFAKWEMHFE